MGKCRSDEENEACAVAADDARRTLSSIEGVSLESLPGQE